MLGVAVFIYSLLHYISYYMKGTGLRINIVTSEKNVAVLSCLLHQGIE
ncbi:MAG: hypothetical protein N4J56_000953 [Chroococcidiopsis sp. SAG 2025]|nr:hypothetical protein [Chroococcidiopsis sp. SAG 2025]